MSNTTANEENNAYIDFGGDTAWTEIKIKLPADSLELAESIASMTVPYGFYVEDSDRRVLYIEPGLAFGTGTHDTTKLCLSALSERILGGESVLDLGCGSGILALSALLLGASAAEGVDISDIAAKTAVENGKINGFTEPQYKIHCGDMTEKITGTYDIVVANIVADIIILFCQNARRFMKPDGIFIVSGIIETREEDVTAAFNEYGFTVIERKESNGWLCFVLN